MNVSVQSARNASPNAGKILAFQHVVIQKVDQAVGASFLIIADTVFLSHAMTCDEVPGVGM